MTQDRHRQAVERYKDAQESLADQYSAMREDLRFSDPTDPKQWDQEALDARKGRPCLTLDRSNQYIGQVVNAGRQNRPSIKCLPADAKADIAVAEKLNGIIKHIEYISRADIAYDTALEYAARIGLGWIRVVPEIMRPETNEQEIRIKRIADPLSVHLEAGWSEPDGSDAMFGFIETEMTERAFKAKWPKASMQAWEGATGWFNDKTVRICEYLCIKETKQNRLTISMEGQSITVSEDEYWQLRQQTGMEIPAEPFEAKMRTVSWEILSGADILEETDFPGQLLPLVPVIGHELWVDGKRHLCGMTRRLKDGQKAYNYERSAFVESVAMQPKAPIMAAAESMEGLEDHWKALNKGNPGFLPFNHVDEAGNALPAPSRLAPPAFPSAFAQGGQIALQDMESGIGMYQSNLGAQSNATSGRAKREDKVAGDTSTYHYADNRNRSIAQLGRVIVGMIPLVFDTSRQARIVGDDDEHSFVQVDPEMPQAVRKEGKKVVAINPSVGAYDVMVKTGPAYTTLLEEQAEQLSHIMTSAPDMVPILADLYVGALSMPDGDKARKRLQAMLPPQIQQMESDEGEDVPPAAQAMIAQLQQQLQQMQQQLQEASQAANAEQTKVQIATADREVEMARLSLEAAQAKTERMKTEAEARLKNAQADAIPIELQVRAQESKASIATEYIKAQSDVEKSHIESQRPPEDSGKGDALQARIDALEKSIAERGESAEDPLAGIKEMLAGMQQSIQAMGPRTSMFTIEKRGPDKYVGTKTEH